MDAFFINKIHIKLGFHAHTICFAGSSPAVVCEQFQLNLNSKQCSLCRDKFFRFVTEAALDLNVNLTVCYRSSF